MTFTYEWTVRFSDSDPFGIAHYPRIVEAVHEVSDVFVESIGYPYWEMAGELGFGLPLIEIGMEFERPIRAGETVVIELTPRVGTSSVRFEYEARRDGETVFTAFEQRACVPVDGDSAVPLPDDLREALEAHEPD